MEASTKKTAPKSTPRQRLAKQQSTNLPQLKLYHTELGWHISESQLWAVRNNYFQDPSENTLSLLKKVQGQWQELLKGNRQEVFDALKQRTNKKPVFSNLEHPTLE